MPGSSDCVSPGARLAFLCCPLLQDGSESGIEVDPEGYELTEAIADFFEA